ncbi:MAG: hypothetical protein AMXMBFR12_04510 [Candidatus Babeliales bacterium]
MRSYYHKHTMIITYKWGVPVCFPRISWILLIALAIPGHSCRAAGVSVPTAAMVVVKGIAGLVALAPVIDFFDAIKKDKEAKIRQQSMSSSFPLDQFAGSSYEPQSVLPILGGIAVLFAAHFYFKPAAELVTLMQTDKQEIEAEKG